MICEKCSSGETQVINSRLAKGNTRRRQHKCKDCGFRFATLEMVVKDKTKTDHVVRTMEARGEVFALQEKIRALQGKARLVTEILKPDCHSDTIGSVG